jgi:hypothetical protein
MPMTTGPTGKDPFVRAPRTPGTLGINDAADPSRPKGLLGDTPGTLGVNDHAAGIADRRRRKPMHRAGKSRDLEKWLDSLCDWNNLSGPMIAFESSGHFFLTNEAVRIYRDFLPPDKDVRERMLKIFDELPGDVDVTDWTLEQLSDTPFIGRFLPRDGQATHFMAKKDQEQWEAFQAGKEKVFGPADEAVRLFKLRKDCGSRLLSGPNHPAVKLGDALHALQDSFSPEHVRREKHGDQSIIMEIFVWRDQTSKEHKAGDKLWRDPDIRAATVGASVMLLRYFVYSIVNKEKEAAEQKSDLIYKYLWADPSVDASNWVNPIDGTLHY